MKRQCLTENRAWRLVLAAGLVAGLAAFAAGEATYGIIPARRVMLRTIGAVAPQVTPETQTTANVRNAALAFTLQGALLAGFLGAVGGIARRSTAAAIGAGFLGAILGAGLAAGVSLASLRAFSQALVNHSDYDMAISILMHGTIWGLTGAAAGLALAIGLGGGPRRLAAGILLGFVGAAIGTLAFDILGAGLFPLAETGEPVSLTWPSRLAARMLVAIATAAVLSGLPASAIHAPEESASPAG
ncbi:MAG: hypothetical protein ACYC61_10830 [Isosphaeraceae bacterium]